ncbi:MAG: biotin/lipoyl-binding protein, partial [Verrucomicrobiota bacterium]|nr:biotin/lipoyl-binding protein [Verrucomicrobiota bacterium]
MKRIALILLVILLLGGGAWRIFGRKGADQPRYITAAVTRGNLTQAVTATGQLNPVKNVTVGSQISGIIAEIFVDFNSPVKAGEVVAQLDAATYQAIVHQSEGDLASAKAALELAQLTAKRKQELVK